MAEFEYLMTFISLSTAHRAAFLARWKPYIEAELPAESPIPAVAAIFPGSKTSALSCKDIISKADLEAYGFQNVASQGGQDFTAVCDSYESFENALETMERRQGVKFYTCRYRTKTEQFQRQYECYKAGDPDFVVKKEDEERKTTSKKAHCPASISISTSMAYANLKNLHKQDSSSEQTQPMETQPNNPSQGIDTCVWVHLKLDHKHPHQVGSIMDKADLPIDPR